MVASNKTITVIYKDMGDRWVAECKEFPYIYSWGADLKHARYDMLVAVKNWHKDDCIMYEYEERSNGELVQLTNKNQKTPYNAK